MFITAGPTHGAPDTLMFKLCNQNYQSNLVGPERSGLPRGACDLKVPEEPLQLRRNRDNAGTHANMAGGMGRSMQRM